MKKKVCIFDIDGVWTNGKLTIDETGRESKQIDFRDIDAYFSLKKKGCTLAFITGEDTPIALWFKRRFEPNFFYSGAKDKISSLADIEQQTGLDPSDMVYIGDSMADIPVIDRVGMSFAPSNALEEVKSAATVKLERSGGDGAIAEMIAYLHKESLL